MLSLLKKRWNWLKSLFIASPRAINPKEVKNTPPEPSDGEYEGILMGLFEQVAAGTTTDGLRGWLYSRHCNDNPMTMKLGTTEGLRQLIQADYKKRSHPTIELQNLNPMTMKLGTTEGLRQLIQADYKKRSHPTIELQKLNPMTMKLGTQGGRFVLWVQQGQIN